MSLDHAATATEDDDSEDLAGGGELLTLEQFSAENATFMTADDVWRLLGVVPPPSAAAYGCAVGAIAGAPPTHG